MTGKLAPESVEQVVPSYEVWPFIRAGLDAGTLFVIVPSDMDLGTAYARVGAAMFGLRKDDEPPVKVIVPKAAAE